jgi:hypothetical protein
MDPAFISHVFIISPCDLLSPVYGIAGNDHLGAAGNLYQPTPYAKFARFSMKGQKMASSPEDNPTFMIMSGQGDSLPCLTPHLALSRATSLVISSFLPIIPSSAPITAIKGK